MHTLSHWARQLARRLQLPHSGPAFYRLLASFLAMLVLPFATLLFNYVYAQRLLRQENLNYQNAVLVQAQMVVDEKLQSLQLFALDMQNDQTISSFLTSDDLAGGALQTEIWSLSQYLSSYTATYRNLCQSYVYSIHYDYLIGPQSADSGVSDRVIRLDSPSLNRQLQEELLQPRQFCRYVTLRDGSDSALVLLHSVPLWSTGRAENGTVCLVVNSQALFETISEMQELQAGLVCLLDEEGKVIVCSGDSALMGALEQASALGEGFLPINGTQYTVSSAPSSMNGWRYLSIQPQHAVVPRLRFTRNLSLGILGAVLVLGSLAAWELSRRNYRPLEHLMDTLRHQSGLLRAQANDAESEFSLIEHSVNDLADSMQMMRGLVQDELPHIQEGLLLQLLRNAVTDYPSFLETLSNMGILLPYSRFCVAVIRQTSPDNFEEQMIVHVILKEQISKLVPTAIPYAMVAPQSDTLVIILNSNAPDLEEQAARAMQAVADSLRSEFSRMVSITLSRAVGSIQRVPHAYYTASQVKADQPVGGVLRLSQQPPVQVEQSIDEIAVPLKNYIATGDSAQALKLLQARYRNGIEGRAIPSHTLQGYYASLLNLVSSAYTPENGAFLLPDGSDPLAALFLQRDAAGMEHILETMVSQLCKEVQNKQKSHAAQLTGQILAFLQQEYANSELTLSYTADHFYITSSYLSTFFKENVGDTFLNHLTRLRVEHAKELIRTTNLSMGEIALRVGYASGNTFTRIFKKMEGITPTQYRESASK